MESRTLTAFDARPRAARSRALPTLPLLVLASLLSGCTGLRMPSLPSLPSPGSSTAQPPAAAKPPVADASAETPSARLLAQGWRCEDGSLAGSRVPPGSKTLELRIGDARPVLPQVASASGARFESADWLFWNRGAQALLQRKPSPPVYCNEVRSLSLVEDARARGITFRGQGNAPGWLLEVGPANRVVLSGAPGGSDTTLRQAWPDLRPVPGPVYGSTRYTGEAGGRRYQIVVTPDPCVDDMSGQRFQAVVRIEIDGKRLRGCGTPIAP